MKNELIELDHELRVFLSPIIGYSKLLMKTELNEIQREYISKINLAGQSILKLLNDFRHEKLFQEQR